MKSDSERLAEVEREMSHRDALHRKEAIELGRENAKLREALETIRDQFDDEGLVRRTAVRERSMLKKNDRVRVYMVTHGCPGSIEAIGKSGTVISVYHDVVGVQVEWDATTTFSGFYHVKQCRKLKTQTTKESSDGK